MYKEITAVELKENVFDMIHNKWTLISAMHNDEVNSMTASWGGLGILWNKNIASIYIRPQRYTKHLIDASDTFSLTFYTEEYRQMLKYMGTVSGRDEDKIKHENLHLSYDSNTPYFEEASTVIICRKLYAQDLKSECFINTSLIDQNYPQQDFHTMYIGEIIKILVKE